DLRTRRIVAPLRGVADRVAHVGETAAIEQVDDQLQLVHALEVGDLRLVARVDERLEARLHQRADAAAQHRLLAEQIRLGLFLERRLDDARARAADAAAIRERQRLRVAREILMHGEQTGNAAALRED